MHLHLEQTSHVRSDSSIQSLSWMGRVPEEQPEGDGWKLNRASYYQEGWLATGNTRGVVGVTYTSTVAPNKTVPPPRSNFNLRGHRTPICLVRWNEPYQKLATCDTSGVIFVWIRYEGRWSIELINDRNTPVTHFAWSHDGRMALISYQDGFVLVGSVAGQRYWSTMLSIESTMSCGAWTPDDQHVYVGTTNGTLLVLDVYGTMVAQLKIAPDVPLSALQWNCPRFKMEESTTCAASTQSRTPVTSITNGTSGPSGHRAWVLAVLQASGQLTLMKAHDDVSPVHVDTGLKAACIDWSNAGDYLCVAGHVMCNNQVLNWLKFYTEAGHLRYSFPLSATQVPITSITWGHNDRRLFVATGSLLHVAWVTRKVPTLQHLARLEIKAALPAQYALENLLLPRSIRHIVDSLFLCTLQSYIPDKNLRDFVCRPPQGNTRLYCTMVRKDEETNASAAYSNHGEQLSLDTGYVLYLETLGSLQPLLKGKPTSKLRPDFVIFDPQSDCKDTAQNGIQASNGSSLPSSPWLNRRSIRTPVISRRRANAFPGNTVADEAAASDSEPDDSCIASPRLQRRWKRRHAPLTTTTTTATAQPTVPSFSTRRELDGSSTMTTNSCQADSAYDPLPEYEKLAQVTSNIWGTKFKIHGLSSHLPAFLGQVTYKTSLLHLQPRQMTLLIVDLRDPPVSVLPSLAGAPDKAFDPYQFSEDEEEIKELPESVPPIAPMTPRLRVRQRRQTTRAAKPSADLLEPPPAPTHRPCVKNVSTNGIATAGGSEHLEDVLRIDVDTNEQLYLSTDRVVFASKRRVRSLSVGHVDKMNRPVFYSAVPAKNSRSSLHRISTRKCRSLDSSPQTSAKLLPTVMSWNKENPRTSMLLAKNLRASFRSTLMSSKDSESPSTSTSTSSTTSSSETSVKMSSMKAHSCMTGLARLSPLLGRKWERWQGRNQAEALSKRNGVSAPTTPNASPLVPRRRPKRERHASPIRQLFNSPLLSRKLRKERQPVESSDSEDEAIPKTDYRDLESFQKAQLLQKFKQSLTPEVGTPTVRRKQFILNNKAPLWNEHSQVYQLDFGGRVTQESAKNFQIEYRGKQVMQFGRIDGNAYTLDFQYPFSAVQAFAVALANVTQRLK